MGQNNDRGGLEYERKRRDRDEKFPGGLSRNARAFITALQRTIEPGNATVLDDGGDLEMEIRVFSDTINSEFIPFIASIFWHD